MSNHTPHPLNVLVLGGSGHIGSRWLATQNVHCADLDVRTWSASRGARPVAAYPQVQPLVLDTRDGEQLDEVLRGMDVVINCVAGSYAAITQGMALLCQAALRHEVRLIHLSTQSVYGPFEGVVHESMPLDPRLGWYGQAKCEAEMRLRDFVRQGGRAVVLRPGCVWGSGSELWVGRIARWLRAGRLGDLGAAGDGWSNLVHVDDVCLAISAALQLPLRPGELPTFNLAAPDSPRWNEYFVDLALSLGITPVPRLSMRRLWMDSHLVSPPLKAMHLLSHRLGTALAGPDPLPPGVVRLWRQHIRLDSNAATRTLALPWTPYATGLADSVRWVQPHLQPGSEVACLP